MVDYSLGYAAVGRLSTEQVESLCAEGVAGKCVARGEKRGGIEGERSGKGEKEQTLLTSNITRR